jgi:general secretion pathway protein G
LKRRLATKSLVHGFTLIELLVVIIILAILAAVVIPRFVGRTEDAKVAAAITQIKNFDDVLSIYNSDTGQFPPTLDALVTNTNNDPRWHGPYLKNAEKIPLDPWGHPYVYTVPGGNGRDYDIVSAGPDGQPGTADDIQSWNVQKQ